MCHGSAVAETHTWTTADLVRYPISDANVSRERSARACSYRSLEAILARVIDVAFDRALTVAREPQARVEPVRVVEARIRPEDQPADASRATPLQRALHQRITQASPAPLGIDVETMQLGGVAVESLDAHRSDHAPVRPDDPESAAGRS